MNNSPLTVLWMRRFNAKCWKTMMIYFPCTYKGESDYQLYLDICCISRIYLLYSAILIFKDLFTSKLRDAIPVHSSLLVRIILFLEFRYQMILDHSKVNTSIYHSFTRQTNINCTLKLSPFKPKHNAVATLDMWVLRTVPWT